MLIQFLLVLAVLTILFVFVRSSNAVLSAAFGSTCASR